MMLSNRLIILQNMKKFDYNNMVWSNCVIGLIFEINKIRFLVIVVRLKYFLIIYVSDKIISAVLFS